MNNLDEIKKKAKVPLPSKTISYAIRVDRTLLANFKAAVVMNGSNVTHTIVEFMKEYVTSSAVPNPNNPDFVHALVGLSPNRDHSDVEVKVFNWLQNHGYLITAIKEYKNKDVFVVTKGKLKDYKFELRFHDVQPTSIDDYMNSSLVQIFNMVQ